MKVLLTEWQRKPAGADMERNYITVTRCIKQEKLGVFRFVRDYQFVPNKPSLSHTFSKLHETPTRDNQSLSRSTSKDS